MINDIIKPIHKLITALTRRRLENRFSPANRKTIAFLLDGKRRTHAIYDRIIEKARSVLSATTKNGSNALESESGESIENTRNDSSNDDCSSNLNVGDVDCILKYFLQEKERRLSQGDDSAHSIYKDIQLRHLLADFFGAGVDTTLTTLRWFLLYMAKNPSLQAQLRTV